MIQTNYPIDALEILLDPGCLSERYYSLVRYKDVLLSELRRQGCKTKEDAQNLTDEVLMQIGLENDTEVRLFRRFLTIYDPNPQKFREIEKIPLCAEERAAFRELYYLPGVKQIRASLYYCSGYRSVRDFAEASVDEVLERTARTISERDLTCTVPLPKEVRTQIAAAKAFTWA